MNGVREQRTVEVTVISATDLKKVKKFGGEQRCYVVAYVYPNLKQTSPADLYGGVNPTWNTILKVACYETDLYPAATGASSSSSPASQKMTLEIYSHGGGVFHGSDKLVGVVAVSLQDVVSASKSGDTHPFDVYLPSGQLQGTLNLAVKLGAKRELGQYEDLTAAALPSLGASSSTQPLPNDQPLGKQSSSYTYISPSASPFGFRGESSSTQPLPNDQPSSKQSSGYTSMGPSASPFGFQGASSSTQPLPNDQGSSKQPSGYTSMGSSASDSDPSTGGSEKNRAMPNRNSYADGDDVVTGYPAPEYAFAPLGQLPPRPRQQPYAPQNQQAYGRQQPYAPQNQQAYGSQQPYAPQNQQAYGRGSGDHGPYYVDEYPDSILVGKKARKLAKKEQKRVRKDQKRNGTRKPHGPIGLGIAVIHAVLAPVAKAAYDRVQGGAQNQADVPESSSSQQSWRPQDSNYPSSSSSSQQTWRPQAGPQGPNYVPPSASQQTWKGQDPNYGDKKGQP